MFSVHKIAKGDEAAKMDLRRVQPIERDSVSIQRKGKSIEFSNICVPLFACESVQLKNQMIS